jgi:mannose-6-phosphate isomerase-like protein (cupin superfamily)
VIDARFRGITLQAHTHVTWLTNDAVKEDAMTTPIDVNAVLTALPFLHGRGKDTTDAEKKAAFTTLSSYRDGGIFGGSFSGESQWERHQQGDEIVYIVDGATTLTLIADDAAAPQAYEMKAGMMIVIPQGCWHLLQAPVGVTVMTVTPQPTEHLQADNPQSVALFAQLAAWRQS